MTSSGTSTLELTVTDDGERSSIQRALVLEGLRHEQTSTGQATIFRISLPGSEESSSLALEKFFSTLTTLRQRREWLRTWQDARRSSTSLHQDKTSTP